MRIPVRRWNRKAGAAGMIQQKGGVHKGTGWKVVCRDGRMRVPSWIGPWGNEECNG